MVGGVGVLLVLRLSFSLHFDRPVHPSIIQNNRSVTSKKKVSNTMAHFCSFVLDCIEIITKKNLLNNELIHVCNPDQLTKHNKCRVFSMCLFLNLFCKALNWLKINWKVLQRSTN